MTRGLTEANIPRNDGGEELTAKKRFQVLHHLVGKVRPLVKHGQQDAFDSQT